MIGVTPPPGGRTVISGSTLRGGQMTPSDFDNFSLRFSPPWPLVSRFLSSFGTSSVKQPGVPGTGGGGLTCAEASVFKIERAIAAVIAVDEFVFFMTPSSAFAMKRNRRTPLYVARILTIGLARHERLGWEPTRSKSTTKVSIPKRNRFCGTCPNH